MAPKTFLDLPTELKQMIFDNLIEGVKFKYDAGREDWIRYYRNLGIARSEIVAILFVSKQAYDDFLPMLLHSACINVDRLLTPSSQSSDRYRHIFARLQHVDLDVGRAALNVPFDNINSLMPNLVSVTVRSLTGAMFKVFGADDNSEALLHPQRTSDAAHKLWSKIPTVIRRKIASRNFHKLVGAWKKSGKKFRLIVQTRIVRDSPLMKKVNTLVGFMDLEAKTLEIKEKNGTFRTVVRLNDDAGDV